MRSTDREETKKEEKERSKRVGQSNERQHGRGGEDFQRGSLITPSHASRSYVKRWFRRRIEKGNLKLVAIGGTHKALRRPPTEKSSSQKSTSAR